MHISIHSILQSLQIDDTRQFFDDEIQGFFALHEPILTLPREEQIKELREKWTLSKFRTLVEMLVFLGHGEREILLPGKAEISPQIHEIQYTIFKPHNTETLFQKFIRPKARVDETVDYGYSEFEKSRFANLTTHSDEVYEKIQMFLEGDFLVPTENHSAERLRRERKLSLDLIFTALFKFGSLGALGEAHGYLVSKLDEKLSEELLSGYDTEYGSFHHVLYGMIAGNDDYAGEIGFSQKSTFNFLCLVIPLLSVLREH